MKPMNHIIVTGPRADEIARSLFRAEAAKSSHVLVDRPNGRQDNNLPERRLSSADVLITISPTNQAAS